MKLKKVMKGTNSWLLFVIVLCCLLLALSVASTYFVVNNTLNEKVYTSVDNAVKNYAEDIRYLLKSRLNELEIYATLPQIMGMDWEVSEAFLKQELKRKPEFFDLFFVTDTAGNYNTTELRNAGNVSDREYWKEVMQGKATISDTLVSRSSGKIVSILVVPIWDLKGNQIGALAGHLNMEKFYQMIKSYKLPYENSYGYIINKEGFIIAHPQKEYLLKENIAVKSNLITDDIIVQAKKILSQDHGKVEYTFKDLERYVFFASIPEVNGWRYVLTVPKEVYYEPISQVLFILIFVSLIFILLMFFISRYAVEAKKSAELAVNAKDQFLSTISHELRTPLNVVLGFLQLLHATSKSKEQNEYIDEALNASYGLIQIVEDILHWTKIETKQTKIEKVDFDLRKLIEDVYLLFLSDGLEKGLAFHLMIDDLVPRRVLGDPKRLKQILCNLLSNAVKFTEQGQVNVAVNLLDKMEKDNAVTLRFEIKDTGVGMEDNILPRLIEPFTQADGSLTRKHGGMGLGLAISNELVKMIGGELGVESEKGVGSTFYFSLRYVVVDALEKEMRKEAQVLHQKVHALENLEEDLAAQAHPKFSPMHLLLVEDNAINRKVTLHILEKLGYPCDVVANGKEAIQKAENKAYDVILMDVQMPQIDGYETTRKIREIEGDTRHAVIIALTANAMEGDREKCLEAGMDDYMSKPLDIIILKEVLMLYAKQIK